MSNKAVQCPLSHVRRGSEPQSGIFLAGFPHISSLYYVLMQSPCIVFKNFVKHVEGIFACATSRKRSLQVFCMNKHLQQKVFQLSANASSPKSFRTTRCFLFCLGVMLTLAGVGMFLLKKHIIRTDEVVFKCFYRLSH